MVVPTAFKRTILRVIYQSAIADSVTLQAALMAALTAKYEADGSGRVMTATSLGGHSMQWSTTSATRGSTPQQILEAVEELLTLAEALSAATPTPANDAALFAAMLVELVPCVEYRMDFLTSRNQEGL